MVDNRSIHRNFGYNDPMPDMLHAPQCLAGATLMHRADELHPAAPRKAVVVVAVFAALQPVIGGKSAASRRVERAP